MLKLCCSYFHGAETKIIGYFYDQFQCAVPIYNHENKSIIYIYKQKIQEHIPLHPWLLNLKCYHLTLYPLKRMDF